MAGENNGREGGSNGIGNLYLPQFRSAGGTVDEREQCVTPGGQNLLHVGQSYSIVSGKKCGAHRHLQRGRICRGHGQGCRQRRRIARGNLTPLVVTVLGVWWGA